MSNEEFLAQLQDIRNATLLQNKEIYNTEEACLFLGIKKNSLYDLQVERRKANLLQAQRPGEMDDCHQLSNERRGKSDFRLVALQREINSNLFDYKWLFKFSNLVCH